MSPTTPRIWRFFVASATLVTLVACGPQATVETEAEPEAAGEAAVEVDEAEVHWGYEGNEGPERWAELSPDFALCADGTRQSPIDLRDATPVKGAALQRRLGKTVLNLDQRATVMDLVDNGHTIQVINDAPMSVDAGGEHYELVQFHFHAPSEHTIDGRHSPLEIHFVTQAASGAMAVVGVLVEEGAHDPIFDPVIEALPDGPGDSRHLEGLELDAGEHRPSPERYYRYEGSLTTPPCTEGLTWVIVAEQRKMSADQLEAIVSRLHDNNRPVQPLGERELFYISN